MNIFLVMNPGSRGGRSRKLFQKIFQLLEKNKITFEYQITSSMEDAEMLTREACSRSYDAVIAVGGDGTINRVLNGFYDFNGGEFGAD